MGVTRARELDEAARVLGLHEVILLDHRNGFLPWVPCEVLDADIRAAITRLRPDVVVTFGDDGLYWHPDHIVMYERTTAVVAAMGDQAPALFYVSMPRGSMRGVVSAAAAAAHPDMPMPLRVLGIDEVDAFGLFAAPPTLVIDASEFAATKLAALRCHRSQIAGDGLDSAADRPGRAAARRGALPARGGRRPGRSLHRAAGQSRGELMDENLLGLLRCPFCGGHLNLLENAALVRAAGRLESGVVWCECCAFPIVAGIPVLRADEVTRSAMHALEAGEHQQALFAMLGLAEPARAERFRELLARGDQFTYRDAIAVLSPDPEGTYFVYRFSDPTFVMAESVLRLLGQSTAAFPGRALDLCGGSGHLTRVLVDLQPRHEVFLADMFFWKLWLARTFTAPRSVPVCCDANQPLPFARGIFPTVVLSDAFPYIWHKRLLADEMTRLAGPDGTIVMPHLHSSRGENFSAGMTLTPEGYRELFVDAAPRLFSDKALLDQAIAGTGLNLADDVTPADLGTEPSFTLVANRGGEIYRQYQTVTTTPATSGQLIVNPLYRVERRGSVTELTLQFPTPEYEEEFAECRRYLPEALTLDADLSRAFTAADVGARYDELRQRRVLLDAPLRYC